MVGLIVIKGKPDSCHLPCLEHFCGKWSDMKPLCSTSVVNGKWGKCLLVAVLLIFTSLTLQAKEHEAEQQRIEQFFPRATHISAPEGEYQVRTLAHGAGSVYGYAFQSIRGTDMPADSGKPISMQLLLDPAGAIVDAYMLERHEPNVLTGIPEQKAHDFNAHCAGIRA